jgi:hypothetical protein
MDTAISPLGMVQTFQYFSDGGKTQLDAESPKTIHGFQTAFIGFFRCHPQKKPGESN